MSAQQSTDSLLARVRRLEAAVDALERQVADQSEAAVITRTGAKLTLSGRLTVHSFANSRRVNNVDNPQVVLPDPATTVRTRGAGMTMRHSRLRLALGGGTTFGATSAADMDVDFHGGQFPSSGGRHFPVIRLRTARVFVSWRSAELMIGQETPLISDLNPASPTEVGTPAFAASGNLWLWLPQVRYTAFASPARRVGVQGAVLAPTSGDPAAGFETDNDLAERSSQPFLQARAFARFGKEGQHGEVGCGGHQGRFVPTSASMTSTAIACDLLLRAGNVADLRGEFFTGQALRGLGGGGIGQNLTAANEPARTTGGWAQLNIAPAARVRTGGGCGADHPHDGVTRRRNDTCAVYAAVEPVGALFAGAEWRRIRTEYASGWYTNDHVTLALGWGF